VNVTLLFSDGHYLRTADAYIRALERRRDAGLDLAVPSVASMFISRWDSAANPLRPPALHGLLGLAMAQKAYSSHLQLLSDKRWQALAEAGTRPQRLLWASTSTKNPDLPDTYYLGRLASPSTIDTVPEKTLLAFADHGTLDDRLDPDYAAAEQSISATLRDEGFGGPTIIISGNQSSRLAVPCLRDTLTPRGDGGVMPPCRKLVWPTASRAAQTRSSASPSLAMPG
jgi:transaldolase